MPIWLFLEQLLFPQAEVRIVHLDRSFRPGPSLPNRVQPLTRDLVLRFLCSLTYSIKGRDIASVSEAISQLYRQKDTKLGDCFGRFCSLAIFAICVTVFMRMGTKASVPRGGHPHQSLVSPANRMKCSERGCPKNTMFGGCREMVRCKAREACPREGGGPCYTEAYTVRRSDAG